MVKGLSVWLSVVVISGSPLSAAGADPETRDEKIGRALGIIRDRMVELEKELEATRERVSELEKQQPGASKQPSAFDVYWDDGLRFKTRDARFASWIGGRIMNDWSFMTQERELKSRSGGFKDGTEMRSGRFFIRGLLYEKFEFKAEYDFAGGDADFKDVYMGIVAVPVVGGIRIGHFREPFSLEQLTSLRFITFLERSLPISAFSPRRNVGIMAHKSELEDRLTWAVGFFHDADGFGNGTNDERGGEYDATVRLTGLPWRGAEGELIHLGASYHYRRPADDQLQLKTGPEAHLAPAVADTGLFDAHKLHLVGVEGAVCLGPVWAQSEYAYTYATRSHDVDPEFWGVYASAGWFLTGERRGYKKGAFRRVVPNANFLDGQGGLGAWEVAARYSYLDLNDEGISGGVLRDVTAALNWYPNPHVRVKANYVFSHLRGTGDAHVVQFRFQVDF